MSDAPRILFIRLSAVGDVINTLPALEALPPDRFAALLHQPQLLLLDEPASGLDPRARIEIKELLKELKSMGKTIIISSHILSELETLCNRVAIIEKGKLIYTGPAQGMRDQMAVGRVFWVKIIGDETRAVELLKARPEVNQVEHTEGRLKVTLNDHETDPGCVAETLVHGGLKLIGLEEEELGLEEVFMRVTRGETQ